MFIEPKMDKGHIEVICGCMFSGKTEELLRRIRRSVIANQKYRLFKPFMDTRYHPNHVVSHDQNSIASIPVSRSSDILTHLTDEKVVGIDEAQFFDPELPDICDRLSRSGIRVIVAGLDMDFRGKPFGPMPQLLAIAEYVTKVHAICMKCGDIASFTYKINDSDEPIELGSQDLYQARCRSCFKEGMKIV